MKSEEEEEEEEEEELLVEDRHDEDEEIEEEEEVDEAELEAFLDGQLEDGLPFLPEEEETHQDVAAENMEQDVFISPSSKGEEALRTCK